MYTKDDIECLPDDPRLAFFEFEALLRRRVEDRVSEAAHDQYIDADEFRWQYINLVVSAAKHYDIDEIRNYAIPGGIGTNTLLQYRAFTGLVDHITLQIALQRTDIERATSVSLDPPTKTKIHHFIDLIRSELAAAPIPSDKRDSLLKKLNAFALEVDLARTPLGRFCAFFAATMRAFDDGLDLPNTRRLIDSISTAIGKAKGAEERLLALPASAERKRLEPPRFADKSDSDDDLPF